jgi:hypothetical protein
MTAETLQQLLLVIAGGGLAIVGSWLGALYQRRSEASLEQERNRRSDKYLLHESRLQSYSDFYRHLGLARNAVIEFQNSPAEQQAGRAIRRELWEAYVPVAVVGHRAVLSLATEMMDLVDTFLFAGAAYDDGLWSKRLSAWVSAVRLEMIPGEADVPVSLPLHVGNPAETSQAGQSQAGSPDAE